MAFEIKVLKVDLASSKTEVEVLGEDIVRNWIGGRGVAAYLMLRAKASKADPLGPENPLIFAAGPLSGTSAPTGGRYNVVTKSPTTGFIAFANSGGHFGAALKHAGWDVIYIEGKAEKPVYLLVQDDKVEIKDASHLWGKVVSETEATLRQEIGSDKVKIASIGPAGENLVKIAAIMNDGHRAAGRGGVGAVMGSKNLKAIAVIGSKGAPQPADREKFMQVVRDKVNILRNDPVAGGGLPKYGTAVLVNIINENGLYPHKNFQTGVYDKAPEQSGEALEAKYLVKNQPCFACPIGCGRVSKLPVMEKESEGPEYESIWTFGSNMGINDLASIVTANHLCDEYGLDTISTGSTLAAAMELYENGLIKDEEFEPGPPFRFGNTEVLHYYIDKIAKREGFGDKLAEGSYRLAESYGRPEFSMSVKKLELPAYDPRVAQGLGLHYATCNRGGDHVKGYMISPEILGYPKKMDPLDIGEEKVAMTKLIQEATALVDAAGLCIFSSFGLWGDDYRDLLNAFFGWDLPTEEYIKIGERIWNAERIFNLEAGLKAEDDILPSRLINDPMPEGPHKGQTSKVKEMLPVYYKLRGWNPDGTVPEDKKQQLGL